MKSFSKLLSILLCLSMLIGIFAMTASAASPVKSVTYDFATNTELSGELTAGTAKEAFEAASDGDYLVSVAPTKIYHNNAQGGAFQGNGFLKSGTSSKAGSISLTYDSSVRVTKVEILCHAWTDSSNDTVGVNDAVIQVAPNCTPVQQGDKTIHSASTLTFSLSGNTNVVNIALGKRVFIFKIVVYAETTGFVTPSIPATAVQIPETAEIVAGTSLKMTAAVTPENTTDEVTWSSSNEEVATVEKGVIKALKAGSTTITATAGSVSDTCAVTVVPTVYDIVAPYVGGPFKLAIAQNKEGKFYYFTGATTDKSYVLATSSNVADAVDVYIERATDEDTYYMYFMDGESKKYIEMYEYQADSGSLKLTTDTPASVLVYNETYKTFTTTIGTNTYFLGAYNALNTIAASGTYYISGSNAANLDVTQYPARLHKVVIDVTGVTLDKTTANLTIGEFTQLVATVAPENATNNAVSWSSSNEAVATVDNTGKVTAVAAGTATITVTTADGGKTATCTVTVSRPVAESVTIAPTSANIVVGETATLAAAVTPNLADQTVTWTSSNEAVATVDNSGNVTAVAAGTATITATTADGSKTATCAVTVVAQTVPATGVTLDKTTVSVKAGETATLTATVAPADTTDNATWTSSNTEVVTVNGGVITAVAPGTATITVTAGSKSATCEVTVAANVTNVTLDKSTADLKVNGEVQLNASVTVNPNQDAYKNVTWTTSDATVATVENGKVKALKAGTVTITATSVTDTTKSASCTITITENTPATQPTTPSTSATTPSTPATTPSTPSTTPSAPAAGTATLITAIDQLVDGQYVLVVGTGYAPGALDGTWVTAAQPTVSGNKVTDAKGAVWTIKVSGGKVTLTDANGKIIAPKGGNNNGIKEGDYQWDVVCENGKFIFKGVGEDTVRLASNSDPEYGNKFRAYKESTATGQYADKYPNAFSLYLLGEETEVPVPPTGDTFQPMMIAMTLLCVSALAVLVINRKRFI